MRKAGFIYDDIFLKHETPAGHSESKERLLHIVNVLKKSSLWAQLIHIKPRKASYEDIGLVHDISYIERVKKLGSGYLDFDTYVSKDSLEAALFAAGAVIEAVQKSAEGHLQRAFCAVRPPGHHAEAHKAMGFCIFNNVAIGARHAQSIGYKRVFIIDFDVHHGNGTQHIFEEDDTVFYFSTHQYPHYPGSGRRSDIGKGGGEGYTYNVPMESGAADEEYLSVYEGLLPELVKKFMPGIVLVSAGYDIHKKDPLSGIRVSDEGIRGIVRAIILSTATPVVFVLEGGYNLPALGESVKITLEEMLNN